MESPKPLVTYIKKVSFGVELPPELKNQISTLKLSCALGAKVIAGECNCVIPLSTSPAPGSPPIFPVTKAVLPSSSGLSLNGAEIRLLYLVPMGVPLSHLPIVEVFVTVQPKSKLKLSEYPVISFSLIF